MTGNGNSRRKTKAGIAATGSKRQRTNGTTVGDNESMANSKGKKQFNMDVLKSRLGDIPLPPSEKEPTLEDLIKEGNKLVAADERKKKRAAKKIPPASPMAQKYKRAFAELYSKCNEWKQGRLKEAMKEKDFNDAILHNFVKEVIQLAEKEQEES